MVLALKCLNVAPEGARIVRVEIDNQILEEIVVGVFAADGYVRKGGKRISGPQCRLVCERTNLMIARTWQWTLTTP